MGNFLNNVLGVLHQLVRAEGDLADGSVQHARLVDSELDLTGLKFIHGLLDVEGDGAGLGVGHHAPGSEHPASINRRVRTLREV